MAITRSTSGPSFSGVALADILANGVAIIVIMIVVTLMSRHEQEQERLEQAEDISVLLSREIASSFVMNSLPTSAPAVLHDYVNSPLDQNPHESKMPIIELREGFIRNYYTGEVFTRDELLLYQNAFDVYVQNLSKEQLLAMRIDVYSISQFYLTMSILKAHKHKPRHWHFLNKPDDEAGGEGAFSGIFRKQQQYEDAEWKKSVRPGDSRGSESLRALPEDIELALPRGQATSSSQRLPFGTGKTTKSWRENIDLPPVSSDSELRLGGEFWKMLNMKRNSQQAGKKRKTFRAAIDVEDALLQLPANAANIDLLKLARAYMGYMGEVQVAVDNGLSGLGKPFNFRRDILIRAELLGNVQPDEDKTLFDNLAYWLSQPIFADDYAVPVVVEPDGELPGQHVVLPVNDPVQAVRWLRDDQQPELAEDLPDLMQMHIRLGLYPDIYRGVDLPVGLDAIVMMPRAERIPDANYRWRIVTLVNPQVNDIVTGFVYAAITKDGSLLLPVDENAVALDHFRLTDNLRQQFFLSESWQIIFYTLIVAIFILAAVHRYRRRA